MSRLLQPLPSLRTILLDGPPAGVATEPSREAFATRDRIRVMAGVATGFAPLSGALAIATVGLALTADWSSARTDRPRTTALTTLGGLRLMTWGGLP